MFKQIAKYTLLVAFWRSYKKQVLVIFFALFAWLVVDLLFNDIIYLASQKQSADSDPLLWAYIYKWLAYLAIALVAAFLLLKSDPDMNRNKEAKTKTAKNKQKNGELAKASKHSDGDYVAEQDDPFANIRKKDRLRSKAEVLLDEKNKT